MSTISDVAKLAGVSTMTVSRVINNSGYISQETRERVERAIVKLGYVPNALARGLRFKQTKTIALVLTDITNPFFTTVARGVEDTASEQGFSVMFCNTDESQSEETEYLYVLLQKQIDGVLLVPASGSAESVSLLQERGTPVVVLDRRVSGARVDTVRSDSEQGAYQLIQHLLDLGHTHIAVLGGPQTVSTAADRVAGYHRALADRGLDAHAPQVYYARYTQESGYQMAQQALAATPRPTALFATNNFIAIGAYRALREVGLSVPDDISLVAFDDLPPAVLIDPFLTVAGQPAYEMGQRAAELLFARLAGETPAEPQEIVLPAQVIIRRSSGPPPVHRSTS
jgi:LacI family transcriptional regulator, galactose operon repressor